MVVRVRDTGIGIRAEMLPRVFELFVQAEQRSDRAAGGLGIGLTLVKRLVECTAATVSARSDGPRAAAASSSSRLPAGRVDEPDSGGRPPSVQRRARSAPGEPRPRRCAS